ncbi:TPA_asm: P6 [Rubus alphacytorhabdovirus 1]|nr:TPA_asm: P6 [Rubus alphacytorhabdovirus 1]
MNIFRYRECESDVLLFKYCCESFPALVFMTALAAASVYLMIKKVMVILRKICRRHVEKKRPTWH